ncbi:LysM peptidoglycan-binding domain-containing protein [Oceanobacillus piezotolerans]|uniref:LysM peptidoglycan-binding domain-containing protein n=1 Tax=Oceanobacillus piezotolerans TaxID=2448030 RepID=A0A498DAG7_9BACI|nr:LysM peptidoglycan-binding domain-containing protein [Oceanobacillus piezotolerans]RLL43920.1 LysM peptidoglycan-binding domain-containing protein [Oceanobacillus piezotolerans]
MDILDIVNNFIKKKQEVSPEIIISKLNNGVSEEELLKEYDMTKEALAKMFSEAGYFFNSSKRIWSKRADTLTLDDLCNIVSKMYNEQVSLSYIAESYKLSEKQLIQVLEDNNFRNRWTVTGNTLPINDSFGKAMRYLHQLNIERKSVEEIARGEGKPVSYIEEQLKKANYRKFWVLEGNTTANYAIPTIKDNKVLLDLKTGEPNVLYINGRNFFTLKQVARTLGINAKLIREKYNDEFNNNVHYVTPMKYFNTDEIEIFNACPHINYIRFEALYTEIGLSLFASLTNTTSLSRRKIVELENLLMNSRGQEQTEEKSTLSNVATISDNQGSNKTSDTNNSDNELNPKIIVQTVNAGESLTVIAKKYSVQVSQITKLIRNAGYQFNSFFKVWTEKKENTLIEASIRELNKGITLYDFSDKYVKNKKEKILFADELRRKIEDLGYNFDQKTKRWVLKSNKSLTNQTVKDAATNSSPFKETTGERLVKPNNTPLKNEEDASGNNKPIISTEEIIGKLYSGSTLKTIEEDTGIAANQLRIQLKADGYKYDSFFKTYINRNKAVFLKNIAEDIINDKTSVEQVASKFGVSKDELEELLEAYGYNIKNKNEPETESIEGTVVETKKAIQYQENEDDAGLVESKDIIRATETVIDMSLSREEILLIKELLRDKEKEKDEVNSGKQSVKIYLNQKLLEKVEEFTERNNITKSNLVAKALEEYLDRLDFKNEF